MADPAAHIRRLREAAGLTQAELASLVGVSRWTECRWESGVHVPRGEQAARLALALGEPNTSCGHYPHHADGLCRSCYDNGGLCSHIAEGLRPHHAHGLCRACYQAARPRWPSWLDACLECGTPKEQVSYRSWGLCSRCSPYHRSLEVRLRYHTTRWGAGGDTLGAALLEVTRREGVRDVALALRVPVQRVRAVLSARPRIVPIGWASRLWELSKELAA